LNKFENSKKLNKHQNSLSNNSSISRGASSYKRRQKHLRINSNIKEKSYKSHLVHKKSSLKHFSDEDSVDHHAEDGIIIYNGTNCRNISVLPDQFL
jgi:hypothetical protein